MTADLSGFDDYCEKHDIQPGEEPAAFAAFLHEQTGWDGPMGEVGARGPDGVVMPQEQADAMMATVQWHLMHDYVYRRPWWKFWRKR